MRPLPAPSLFSGPSTYWGKALGAPCGREACGRHGDGNASFGRGRRMRSNVSTPTSAVMESDPLGADNRFYAEGERKVWRWQSGECRVLQGHKEQVRHFSLLANDSRLLSWSFDGTVMMWDTASGEKLQDVEAHRGAILSCDVSPDARLFATTSADKTAKDCVRSCRFSWDNRRLATGDDNGEIRSYCRLLTRLLLLHCGKSTSAPGASVQTGETEEK
ncbi:Apoptotic protease-activating factor 1 [Liparis tanakae]|uniref:Apoptotic protease-activating factor 1 n=1 Tax=Liparis tanakae TaxID=230148 RepID=A0A4Z2EUR0_9TELE|nr:Apoptotic protease-activating factor 1 [Liparis tanakae]